MDWLAAILELTGNWLVGNKQRLAFVVLACCNLTWAVVAIRAELYGLLLVTTVSLVINVRNWTKWCGTNQN